MNIDQLTAKLIEGLLPEDPTPVQEVGEGSAKVFPYVKEHDDVDLEDGYLFGTTVYSFTDSKDHYYTAILEYEGLEVTVSFTADESFEQTHSNELYSVISTVFQIIKQDISQSPKNLVNLIKYTPASTKGKPGQSQKGADQRDRVYQAYFKRMFPSATVEKEGSDTLVYLEESYKGKRTNDGAPGTFKAKITKAYGGPVTIEKAKKFKNRENATPHDKRQANWFINFHSKNEGLNEIGDASTPKYEWKEVDRDRYYVYVEFTTDSGIEYSVDLESITYTPENSTSNIQAIGIEFAATVKDVGGYSYSTANVVVNKGEMYRVMSTIADILRTYIKKLKAEAIIYSPSKKQGEEFGSQRDVLYKAFIKKAIPEVKFEQKGDMVVALLPDNTYLMINEGKQVGPLYHYTSADGLKGILNSDRINASEEHYLGNDLYYISFTRNKNFHNKGSKFGVKTDYRITLDGDKLSNRYKITPFAYKPGWNYEDNWEYNWLEDEPENVVRDFFNNTGDYDEQEERISFKGPEGGIDNIKNYILSIDKVEDVQEDEKNKLDPVKENYEFKISDKDYDSEDNSLITVEYKFSTPDNTYRVEFYSGEYSPKSKIFDVSFGLDKGYNYKLDTFQMTGEGNASSILKTVVNIIIDFTNKFEVNKLVINPTSEKREKVYSIILKSLPSNILNKIELIQEANTAAPYGSGYKPLEETLEPLMVELTKYMYEEGLPIDPAPTVEFVEDEVNAQNPLGRTAYYDPQNQHIVLYITSRHPKDILRSFAHEMIHHIQNLEGRLTDMPNTTNVNEDDRLKAIEEEAYTLGNMYFRSWENNKNNKK